MKRDYFFVWAAMAAVGVAAALVAPLLAAGTVVVAAGLAGIAWLSRCRHGDRLGLLPPSSNRDGTRIPARWYCDRCGRSWPAGLEHDREPVVRYTGYDESKFPAAARRAAAQEKERQALAVRRAGLVGPRLDTPSAAATVTAIGGRRATR